MDPMRGVADLTAGDWAQFHAGLAATMFDLEHTTFLNIRVPRAPGRGEPESFPQPGLFNQLFGRRRRPVDPLLQFFRMAYCLYGECAGPVEDGGGVWFNDEQKHALAALGWAQAQGEFRENRGFPNYCVYFPHHEGRLSEPPRQRDGGRYQEVVDFDRAATLAIDTLRGPLVVESPGQLRIERTG